jgi:hypothetical protein
LLHSYWSAVAERRALPSGWLAVAD